MKRFINIILILVAIVSLYYCVVVNGLRFWLGFIPLMIAVLELINRNTNWIKER